MPRVTANEPKVIDEINLDQLIRTGFTNSFGNLKEAEFDTVGRNVQVTVIRAGWSLNDVYYPESVLEQIVTFLNSTAKKVYLNHVPPDAKYLNRTVQDWVADCVQAWLVKEETTGRAVVKAKMHVFDNGPHAWIWERMQTNRSDWGPSIVGAAEINPKGQAEGRTGKVVQKIVYIKAFELVDQPAAGGKIDALLETRLYPEENEETSEMAIDRNNRTGLREQFKQLAEGVADTLKAKVQTREMRQQLYDLLYTYEAMVYDMVCACNDYQYSTVDERKAEFVSVHEEMKNLLAGLTWTPPKEMPDEMKKGMMSQKTEDKNKRTEMKEGEDPVNMQELQTQHPALFEQAVNEGIRRFKESEEQASKTTRLAKLETENKTLTEQVGTLTSESTALKTENATLKQQVVEAAAIKLSVKKAEIIDRVCQECKLTDKAKTEVFVESLKAITIVEGKEADYEKQVKLLVEDRVKLTGAATKSVVEGAGFASTSKKDDDEAKPADSKSLAEGLKRTL